MVSSGPSTLLGPMGWVQGRGLALEWEALSCLQRVKRGKRSSSPLGPYSNFVTSSHMTFGQSLKLSFSPEKL